MSILFAIALLAEEKAAYLRACSPRRGWKHSDECSTPPLPYISLFIPQRGWCQGLVIHMTQVIHRLCIWTPEEEEEEGGRGGEQDMLVKRQKPVKGRDSAAHLWKGDDKEAGGWRRRVLGWWAVGYHACSTQLYLFRASLVYVKLPQLCFLQEWRGGKHRGSKVNTIEDLSQYNYSCSTFIHTIGTDHLIWSTASIRFHLDVQHLIC